MTDLYVQRTRLRQSAIAQYVKSQRQVTILDQLKALRELENENPQLRFATLAIALLFASIMALPATIAILHSLGKPSVYERLKRVEGEVAPIEYRLERLNRSAEDSTSGGIELQIENEVSEAQRNIARVKEELLAEVIDIASRRSSRLAE